MGEVQGEVVSSEKLPEAPKPAIVDAPASSPAIAAVASIVSAPRRDSRSLAERIGAKDGKLSLIALAEAACLSKLFAGIHDPAQALMKMVLGRELGIAPASSLRAIYITEDGRIGLYAETMAAMLRRHPRYDYRVPENTSEACTVTIIERRTGEVLGETRWALKEDAAGAGLLGEKKKNWMKYPRAMLFARALTEACRVHAPDVFAAMPIVAAEDPTDEIAPDAVIEAWPLDGANGGGGDEDAPQAPASLVVQVAGRPGSQGAPSTPAIVLAQKAEAPPAPTAVAVKAAMAPISEVEQRILAGDDEVRTRLGPACAHIADSILAATAEGLVEPESIARELHNVAIGRAGSAGAMKLWGQSGVKPGPGVRLTGRQARAFVALLPE